MNSANLLKLCMCKIFFLYSINSLPVMMTNFPSKVAGLSEPSMGETFAHANIVNSELPQRMEGDVYSRGERARMKNQNNLGCKADKQFTPCNVFHAPHHIPMHDVSEPILGYDCDAPWHQSGTLYGTCC